MDSAKSRQDATETTLTSDGRTGAVGYKTAQLNKPQFEPNAILRGAQLTLVGAQRALQNPDLFTTDHYRQAAYAVAIGIGIRLLVAIPIIAVNVLLWLLSFVYSLDDVTWDDTIIDGLNFTGEYVLQVPFFVMTIMRYVVPTLDNLFMQSLHWVDVTYVNKHRDENPKTLRAMYYPNLRLYEAAAGEGNSQGRHSLTAFLYRSSRKAVVSLVVFALSYTPLVGKFVLPAASFYTFNNAVGLAPAAVIFGTGIILPRRYLVVFLQTYFSSRSLMRELLEPYLSRVHFTSEQQRNWFRSREGVLFGFGLGFYMLIRVPLVGVLIYGIAEASTAYLVTKVTDPPPPLKERARYAANEQVWHNKHEFLSLSLANLDGLNAKASHRGGTKDTLQNSSD